MLKKALLLIAISVTFCGSAVATCPGQIRYNYEFTCGCSGMKVNIAVCQGLLGTNCNPTGNWRFCGIDCYVADANANCLDGANLQPGAKGACSPAIRSKKTTKQPLLENKVASGTKEVGD
jgi:hypothetical protein